MLTTNQNKRRNDLKLSAFWQCTSIHLVAKLLDTSVEDLRWLASKGAANYRQYEGKKRSSTPLPGGLPSIISPLKKGRWIEAPRPNTKRIQRRIHVLLRRLNPPEYLFSGFRGRSAALNGQSHDSSLAIVQVDIRRFFPSSDGTRVFTFFNESLGCAKDISHLLWRICTIPDKKKTWVTHLPTGGSTSPILAYFMYMDMFDALERLALSHDLKLTVLADDLTFSGAVIHPSVLPAAEEIIEAYSLQSNWRKRRVLPSKHLKKIVTGVHLTSKGYRVPYEQKKKIAEIWTKIELEPSPQKRAKLYQQLCGFLASAGQIEPGFKATAAKKHKEWRADKEAWEAHLRDSGSRKK